MFGFFSPAWAKGLPEHLKLTSAQMDGLENLRTQEEIPHDVFLREVLSSPPIVIRHLHEPKKRLHNVDERKAWLSVVRFWVVSMNKLGANVDCSEARIAEIVGNARDFNELCHRIIEMTPDLTPDPLAVAKNLGGHYGQAIMAAYEAKDHAREIKTRIATILA